MNEANTELQDLIDQHNAWIEMMIRGAEQRAYDRGFKDGDRCTAQSIAKARNETIEECAKIAETPMTYVEWCEYDGDTQIAEKIRNLKSEGKVTPQNDK